MDIISLSPYGLSLAALLVVALSFLSFRMKLGVAAELLVAALRTTIQLLLLGLVLKTVFSNSYPWLIALISVFMLFASGREVMARQKRKFTGLWGYGAGTVSMFISSFSIAGVALIVIVGVRPWYSPQYAIPLLGMLLGNTMNGIAIGLNSLTQGAWNQRQIIEGRLMLGQDWKTAIQTIKKDSVKNALIPIINAMSAAGIISLPGMMTGQILSGTPPVEAVKYQILIMFLIAGGTGFGTLFAVSMGARRLFDSRHRLRLDRLE